MRLRPVSAEQQIAQQRAHAQRQVALADDDKWNSTIHYFDDLLALAPAKRALDVGCGDGLLVRKLSPLVGTVVGLDEDAETITDARASTTADHTADNVEYVCADFFQADLEPGSFDLIVSAATLHHMDAAEALRRMVHLLEPGGRLGIIGISRVRSLTDLAWAGSRALAAQWYTWVRRRKVWQQTAPMLWPPPHTFDQVRQIVNAELPGATIRRRLLRRYTVIWTKP